MATTIVTTSSTPTLAALKIDLGKLAEVLGKSSYPACLLSPGTVAALQAISTSADTTDLRTT